MKLKNTNRSGGNNKFGSTLRNACVASCQNILLQITAAKEAIFSETFKAFRTQEHLLRLALNEAEAVAWETSYPHLLFPALAAEKVQTVIAWDAQQRSLRRSNPVFGLAV